MKIAILGSGNVGGALGIRWAHKGHQVQFASRDPHSEEMQRLLARAGTAASAMTAEDAVRDAAVVLLATPWGAAQPVLAQCGGLPGKVLLDATNPLGPGFALTHSGTDSGGEQVQRWAPQARVVKVFNTTGFGNMEQPVYHGKPSVMFYAGDDAEAKAVARALSDDIGFESIDAGPLENARLLEAWAVLWIKMAMQYGHGRDFAFLKVTR